MHTGFLVVWGMHRSGTSLLAGAMRAFGATYTAGNLVADRFNPTGYFENTDLIELNERMLAELGLKWHSLGAIGSEQLRILEKAGFVNLAVAFLKAEAHKAPLVILKDPRMCRLGGIWRQAFARIRKQPYSIVTWRDPRAVVNSLCTRSRHLRYPSPATDPRYGLFLWLAYTLAALKYTRDYNRVLINYDNFLANPAGGLTHIGDAFALPCDAAVMESLCQDFVSTALNHNADLPQMRLPEQITKLWKLLRDSGYECPLATPPLWPHTDEEQMLAALLDDANKNIRINAAKMASIHTDICILTGECKRMAQELAANKEEPNYKSMARELTVSGGAAR